jgi:hypothetical protein
MRTYNGPKFETKQYWGLVEILKPLSVHMDKVDYVILVNHFCTHLQSDNPRFDKVKFLKALNGE